MAAEGPVVSRSKRDITQKGQFWRRDIGDDCDVFAVSSQRGSGWGGEELLQFQLSHHFSTLLPRREANLHGVSTRWEEIKQTTKCPSA